MKDHEGFNAEGWRVHRDVQGRRGLRGFAFDLKGEWMMVWAFVVAAVLFLLSLLTYGSAMFVVVRMAVGLAKRGKGVLGFWRSVGVMAKVMLVMAGAHLVQIGVWAGALMGFLKMGSFEAAFYLSAQNYTSLGYGDVQVVREWRLLGPLEAINGLLFFGLSTSVMFAALSQLVAQRVRAEVGEEEEGKVAVVRGAGDVDVHVTNVAAGESRPSGPAGTRVGLRPCPSGQGY